MNEMMIEYTATTITNPHHPARGGINVHWYTPDGGNRWLGVVSAERDVEPLVRGYAVRRGWRNVGFRRIAGRAG